MIHLDRASATPLTDQIVQQTAGLIQAGQLPAGSRLPSIRKLAATLFVSSATVVASGRGSPIQRDWTPYLMVGVTLVVLGVMGFLLVSMI